MIQSTRTVQFLDRLAHQQPCTPAPKTYRFRNVDAGAFSRTASSMVQSRAPADSFASEPRPPLPRLVTVSRRLLYTPTFILGAGATACALATQVVAPPWAASLVTAAVALGLAAGLACGLAALLLYAQGDLRRAVAPGGQADPRLRELLGALPPTARRVFATILQRVAKGLPAERWAEAADFLNWAGSRTWQHEDAPARLAELLQALPWGQHNGQLLANLSAVEIGNLEPLLECFACVPRSTAILLQTFETPLSHLAAGLAALPLCERVVVVRDLARQGKQVMLERVLLKAMVTVGTVREAHLRQLNACLDLEEV